VGIAPIVGGCDLIAFLKFCGNFAHPEFMPRIFCSCDLIAFLKFCGNFAQMVRKI